MTDDLPIMLDRTWTDLGQGETAEWQGWLLWVEKRPGAQLWDYGCESDCGHHMASRFTRAGMAVAKESALRLATTCAKLREEAGP